jgi:hypothetical protein
MRSNTSLDSSRDFTQGCGGSFKNWLCLIPFISGQREKKFFSPPDLPNFQLCRAHMRYVLFSYYFLVEKLFITDEYRCNEVRWNASQHFESFMLSNVILVPRIFLQTSAAFSNFPPCSCFYVVVYRARLVQLHERFHEQLHNFNSHMTTSLPSSLASFSENSLSQS